MPQHAAFPVVSSPSASPRSRPSLTVFGVCQGIFPALTNPKNCCTTMRDRGDAEAVSAPRNPNSATNATHHPPDRPTISRCKIRRTARRPPPNPGGYGPFSIYRCQAPNGWLAGNLWITRLPVDSRLDTSSQRRVRAAICGSHRLPTGRHTRVGPGESATDRERVVGQDQVRPRRRGVNPFRQPVDYVVAVPIVVSSLVVSLVLWSRSDIHNTVLVLGPGGVSAPAAPTRFPPSLAEFWSQASPA